ncbi:unnamed protein product, partial [Staurois parvus]
MRRCSGGPCSTYLVLRSRDVSPAASPAISSGRCRHPASVFRSPKRTGAAGGGKFKKFKKCLFFFFSIFNMLCPVPCLHFVCSF